MKAHVGRTRCDARDAEVVIAAAPVTVVERIIPRPFLFIAVVFSVTSKHLSDGNVLLVINYFSRPIKSTTCTRIANLLTLLVIIFSINIGDQL